MNQPKPKKIRLLSTANVMDVVHRKFENLEGVWLKVLGTPVRHGFWIIYGSEKNGKTWFALMLFLTLAKYAKCLYISGEEGISANFQDTLKRIGLPKSNKGLNYYGYMTFEEIVAVLNGSRPPKVVFIDNITFMMDELKGGRLKQLKVNYPDTLFICIAHQEDKGTEPYTQIAKTVKKLSEIILRVEGLTALVSGRCPGGEIYVDEEKAQLFHGQKSA
jgi:predicted ATP-dependent serine protease